MSYLGVLAPCIEPNIFSFIYTLAHLNAILDSHLKCSMIGSLIHMGVILLGNVLKGELLLCKEGRVGQGINLLLCSIVIGRFCFIQAPYGSSAICCLFTTGRFSK